MNLTRRIRQLHCAWSGHQLTERVTEFPDQPTVIAKTLGSWIPVSQELINDASWFSFHYSLRCRCGRVTDPTIRHMFDIDSESV